MSTPLSAPKPKRRRWGCMAGELLILIAVIALIAGWRSGTWGEVEPSPLGQGSSTTAPGAQQILAPDSAAAEKISADELAAAWQRHAQLDIKGRAPGNKYDRALFGQRWSDDVDVEFGRNGCDTRNDILRRDLTNVELKPGTFDCVVLSGTLLDPFGGEEIPFTRGEGTSEAVQIDHIVALADAWQKGAQEWDGDTRRTFANDPRNLIAVDGPLNNQKGAGDAATWLPPNKDYRCEYAARIVEVKHAYGLWATEAEHAALARQLETC